MNATVGVMGLAVAYVRFLSLLLAFFRWKWREDRKLTRPSSRLVRRNPDERLTAAITSAQEGTALALQGGQGVAAAGAAQIDLAAVGTSTSLARTFALSPGAAADLLSNAAQIQKPTPPLSSILLSMPTLPPPSSMLATRLPPSLPTERNRSSIPLWLRLVRFTLFRFLSLVKTDPNHLTANDSAPATIEQPQATAAVAPPPPSAADVPAYQNVAVKVDYPTRSRIIKRSRLSPAADGVTADSYKAAAYEIDNTKDKKQMRRRARRSVFLRRSLFDFPSEEKVVRRKVEKGWGGAYGTVVDDLHAD